MLLVALAHAPSVACDREHFDSAITRRSASPAYVLVTLESDLQIRSRVCIPAPLLLAALRVELKLGDDEAGALKAEKAALANASLVFRLAKGKAFKIASARYTSSILQELRSRFEGVRTEELRRGLASPDGPLHSIYADGTVDRTAYRDALAHVLLERCVAAGLDERTGGLWIAP